MQRVRWMILLASVLSVLACESGEREALPPLELVQITPRSNQGVFLNEELVFEFSLELDRASVTHESVRIQTTAGERARGELLVLGKRLIFRPSIPRNRELSDGGYRPAQQYSVELAGFPRPDGLRSIEGVPLRQAQRWSFTTVELDQPRRKLIFDDPHQERIPPPGLFPGSHTNAPYSLAPGDSLYIACDKPIDPTSVHSEDFYLSLGTPGSSQTKRNTRVVRVHARLLENAAESELRGKPIGARNSSPPEAWRADRRAALIELVPLEPLRPGERGTLRYQAREGLEAHSLRDFSARPLLSFDHSFPRSLQVSSGAPGLSYGEYTEEFLSRNLRTPIVVPGCDGTAYWDDSGRVELRYPLAAGDGREGDQLLGVQEPRQDLQALSIQLGPGQRCELSKEPGLVVLRAQGRISIQGELVRQAPLAQALECPADQTLSAWLEAARAQQPTWTVLIAGGDLVIDGRIQCSTPLLLVAGGQIRVAGAEALSLPKPRHKDEALLWLLGGAGAPLLLSSAQRTAPLVLDPPRDSNPLLRPLRYAVLSGPLPPTGKVERWLSAFSTGWQPRLGTQSPLRNAEEANRTASAWRVLFLENRDPAALDFENAVPNPLFLEPPGSVRMLLELTVGNTREWQAPFIDRVQLLWEEAAQ